MSDHVSPHFCHLILENIPVAVVTMDADFNITSFNNPAEDLTGYSALEVMGKSCSEILHSKSRNTESPLQTLKEAGVPTSGVETELINRYDEHIPVRLSAASIKNDDGEVIGFLEIIEDFSREKSLEREKNNFQNMLAHDMKSPLVAILGLTKRIQEHHEDMSADKLDTYCKTIKYSGEQLESLVLEFLEFSRQVTDKVRLNLEEIDLPELLNQLILRCQPQASEKGSTIRLEYDSVSPILADSRQLQRVFENLFSNAIKFIHQNGEIVTSVNEHDRDVVIQIKDNGLGISDDDLPYIFDAFHQSKSSSKGHGLGLAAVKAIVQGHGGRVSVKSSLNTGSVFTVRIPKRK
ncbi:PAS domain S-box [Desulfocapsa sulfexigens DSM 10523]|uniref:histidine kinase n=1 Tax=Desulfocapsa sulfexigens (strain DSM 10523 / SB164P1) TaxID=1167006 RepID=M1PM81_DESSD|nr:HAMP domain-containing sensor histidine kinase [Desulfocapsa sulfexigens]AGF77541.1 PAS domain S-box [Desulfocapsa sulfexigens DSM 10523]